MAVITVSAARTVLPYDNVQVSLREAYYALIEEGIRPTHMLAGTKAILAYEMVCMRDDPPVTTFKGLPMHCDPTIDNDQVVFVNGHGEVVALVKDIS